MICSLVMTQEVRLGVAFKPYFVLLHQLFRMQSNSRWKRMSKKLIYGTKCGYLKAQPRRWARLQG